MDLKLFEIIDEQTKLAVFGFTRRIQRQLPSNNAYYNIPSSICMICTMYYVTFKDKWNKQLINYYDNMKIDGDRVSGYGRAFLENKVSEGRHIWTFKVHKHWACAGIGIWNMENDPGTRKNRAYLLLYTNCRLNIHDQDGEWTDVGSYGEKCKSGAIISIHVNFNHLTVLYTINGKEFGKAFDIRPGEYSVFYAIELMGYHRMLVH